jgi:hypothetical protein
MVKGDSYVGIFYRLNTLSLQLHKDTSWDIEKLLVKVYL